MASVDVLFTLARTVAGVARPLEESLTSEQAFSTFLRKFGWDVSPSSFSIQDVRNGLPPATALAAASSILAEIDAAGTLPPPTKYVELLDAFVSFVEALEGLGGSAPPAGIPAGAWTTMTSELLAQLLDAYLSSQQAGLLGALLFAGIVTEDLVDPATTGRLPYTQTAISWDRLGQLFTDPKALITDVYDWSTPGNTLRFEVLLARLGRIFPLLGLPAVTAVPTAARLDDYYSATNPFRGDVRELRVTLIEGENADGTLNASLFLLPIPDAGDVDGAPRGIAIGPSIVITGQPPASLFWPFGLALTGLGGRAKYEGARVDLMPSGHKVHLPASSETTLDATVRLESVDKAPNLVFGSLLSHRLEYGGVGLQLRVGGTVTDPEVELGIDIIKGQIVIDLSDGDAFLASVVGPNTRAIQFDIGLLWSSKSGFHLRGSAAMEVMIPLKISFAGFSVTGLRLRVVVGDDGAVSIAAGTAASLTIGPVAASVEDVGIKADLVPIAAGQPAGLLGRLDLQLGFKAPSGLGIAVNSGPVHGGGFISFDPDAGRYSGALELSIYDISVKAFGLIETKVPGVSFSFVIVISAEFTPFQLGFGFTLNGVGGLVGINRTVNSNELGKLVREGRSENLLFPKNLIANAPTIIRDLGTVFPARKDHYVFGPLAKLGWGTPTLITGQIGIIIEVPGVVVILGEIKILLPKPDVPLVKMNMSVAGTLDFPNKTFSLDAALHDSIIEGYPISGQMGLRVKWGDQPNFVASIGGFHPAYQPPKDFPKLQPMTLDLGQHGNASITVSGFFAVTSNTVQVGGDARLHAGGSGISLDASVSVKALFVFAPLHFEATIDASVKISFHGYGPSVHLHGLLEGPSPWHIRGELCVSIVFWDACLGFNETFGGGETAGVPEIDPWDGVPPDVLGLKAALQDAGNWSGVAPVGTAAVVSRAQGSEKLVDPVGGLRVQQKAVPVQTDHPISRFGVAKVKTPIKYELVSATFGTAANPPTLKTLSPVNDFFAPAQYFQMDDGKKLSAPGFEEKQAGYVFGENDANLRAGSHATVQSNYTTYIIAGDGTISEPQIAQTPQAQVAGQNKRSAVALGGVTQLGTRRFIDRLITQPFSIRPPTFILSNNNTLTALIGGQTPASRTSALRSMDAYRLQNKEQRLLVQVSAFHELAA